MNTLHSPDTDRVPRGWMIWLSLGLLVVPLILFWQPLAQNLLIFGWDTVGEFAHWRPWLFGWLKKGVLPFYNPYLLSGYPLGLDPQQAPFYAPNWLYAWLPFARALALSALLHTWWAGLGAYRLSRALGSHRWLALAAALCWQGCSLFQGQLVLGGIPQHCTLAWGAWVLLCVERLLVKPSLRRTSLLALVAGLSFYAGHTQYALYFAYAGGVYALVRLWQDKTLAEKPILCALGLAALLLGGLLAVQLVMVGHLGGMSVRQGGMNPFEDNTTLVVFNLLSFFMPTAMGLETRNFYWGLGVMNLWMPFVGLLWPWLWLSRWRNAFDTPRVAACAAAMVFCLGMGVGLPNVIAMAGFESLPGLNLMRAPMRWWAVACLLMATGGAALLSRLIEEDKNGSQDLAHRSLSPEGRGWHGVSGEGQGINLNLLSQKWLLFPASIMGIGLFFKIFPSLIERFLDLWFMHWKIPTVANIFTTGDKGNIIPANGIVEQIPNDLLMAGGLTLLWMLLALFIFRFAASGQKWRVPVGVLWTALPGVLLSFQQIILVPPGSPHLPPQVISLLKKHVQNGRWASYTATINTPLPRWINENYFHHQLFSQQHQHGGILHGLSNIAGYVSLPPKDYLHLVTGYKNPTWFEKDAFFIQETDHTFFTFENQFPTDTTVLDFLSTKAILCDDNAAGFLNWNNPPCQHLLNQKWRVAGRFKNQILYENPRALPLAWPAQKWSFPPEAKFASYSPPIVFRPNQWRKNPRLVHTDTSLPIAKNTGPLGPQEKVIWTQGATPNLLQLKSTLNKKRLVLASLPFDTAWTARVNGRAVKLYKVNFALTGLVLPRGAHTVLLKYEPPWFSLAAAVSLFFAVLCLLLQAAHRPLGAPAPPPHDG